jgi:hypothetical protein
MMKARGTRNVGTNASGNGVTSTDVGSCGGVRRVGVRHHAEPHSPNQIGHAEEHEDDRARCIGFVVSAREAVLRVHCRDLEKLIQTYEPVHRRDIEWRATIPVEKRSNVKVAKRDFWFSGKR